MVTSVFQAGGWAARQVRGRLGWMGVLAVVALAGCSEEGGNNGTGPGGEFTRDDKWRADLAFVIDKLEDNHPNLYHSVSRGALEAATRTLSAAIPNLSDDEIFVELMRLLGLIGPERDGHLAISFFQGTGFRILPVQFYEFADGVYAVDAKPAYEHLVGKRLTGIGSLSLDQINALIDPLIPRDNLHSLAGYRNLVYMTPEILAALGIVADADQPVYRFDETTETIAPVSPSAYGLESIYNLPAGDAEQLFLSRQDQRFWLSHLESDRTLYLRINQIRGTSGSEDLKTFGARALALASGDEVDQVIVDLRQNNGGNNQIIPGMMDFLTDPAIDQPGRLVVFTDGRTFSAAGNFVAAIDQQTSAVFAGSSPGGSGSQFGDAEQFNLPHSGLAVFIPTRQWTFGEPGFQPLAHPMDNPIDFTGEAFFAGEDPVLAAYLR